MVKNIKDEKFWLEDYLKSNLSWNEFENLHLKLGLTKKMLTMLMREPKKISFELLMQLSTLTGKPLNEFANYINYKMYEQKENASN